MRKVKGLCIIPLYAYKIALDNTIDELRAYISSVQKPSYFNKKHWCKVVGEGIIVDERLYEWLDISYNLVVSKLPKK